MTHMRARILLRRKRGPGVWSVVIRERRARYRGGYGYAVALLYRQNGTAMLRSIKPCAGIIEAVGAWNERKRV